MPHNPNKGSKQRKQLAMQKNAPKNTHTHTHTQTFPTQKNTHKKVTKQHKQHFHKGLSFQFE